MMGKLRYQIISIQLCETKVQARGYKMANQVRKNDIKQSYDHVTLYAPTSVNMEIFHTVLYMFHGPCNENLCNNQELPEFTIIYFILLT